ncbi:conserved hypothetical protein [Planktothrix agardhii]|uniref:DUF58 domain-containing protein n=1 Tax=Planktothrix agardhii TaxID=1160 RepID=UPI001B9DA4DC|nr:DUF58 domain-containing protein [Planktothrix agardhii]CAD0232259.1 conserved hypothetical protein [Planktothrix agardhii]CAH2571540.1 hypothetical protein PRNO82_00938 [Planktothrix rubescens]
MKRLFYRLFYFSYAVKQSRRKRFTTRGLIVLSGVVVTAFLGLDTNQSLTYQIFTFLVSLLVVSRISGLWFRFRFNATRTLPRFATVGVPFKSRIIIHNNTNKTQIGLQIIENFADPRPTLQEFIETPEPGEKQRNSIDKILGYYRWLWLINQKQYALAKPQDLPPLLPRRSTEIEINIIPSRRGVLQFNSLTVSCCDPLGLIYARKTIFLPQSLLILPPFYQVPPIKLPGSKQYQSGGVSLASSVGDSEEFRALRDYRPGDSLRKIHWKSWAKLGKPIVKEEQDEFFVRHALILDTFHPLKYSECLEEAIAIAASVAYEIQTQESLLDLMFVGHEAYCFTFGRGLSHTDKMLEILASVVCCQDKTFDSIIPIIMDRVSLLSGCICIFIDWDEHRKTLINHLNSMGIHTLVLVVTDDQNSEQQIDLESLNNNFTTFYPLHLGKIQEELMKL